MADAIRVSGPVSGTEKTLTFETGRFALQSQGAVQVSLGRSSVLATANAASGIREELRLDGVPRLRSRDSAVTSR